MFGMGTQELLLVLVVALVVFGPKRLPELARTLAKGLNEFRRATSELKQTVEADEQFREVSKSFKEAKAGVKQVFDETVRQAEAPAAAVYNTAFETQEQTPVLDDEALKARFLSEAKEELQAKKTAEAPAGTDEKLLEKES